MIQGDKNLFKKNNQAKLKKLKQRECMKKKHRINIQSHNFQIRN